DARNGRENPAARGDGLMSAFGNMLGIRATLMLGAQDVATPAPFHAMEAIEEIEVRQSAVRRSGLKLTLGAGRDGPLGLFGPPFVGDPQFSPGARIGVTVWNGIKPTVIFEGRVTKSQYMPGTGENEGRYVLLGRDLSDDMDREERRTQHPAQDETAIANAIALSYGALGIVPMVFPPTVLDPVIPAVRAPQQTGTDLCYLREMAGRHGYQVFLDPGPTPGLSTLYFGPTPIPGPPQKTISVNSGPFTDAYDVTVNHDGHEMTAARAMVQDSATGETTELEMPVATNIPMTAMPENLTRQGRLRTTWVPTSGLTTPQALARLMGRINSEARSPIKVRGSIDNARYNAVLKPHRLVQVRGLGMFSNGPYQVVEVRHKLKPGQYTQDFELHRDGLLPIVPVVTPEVASI
ncbi:MAG: hypothetical protein AAFY03_10355, partial [Pseudomonadota bacterium]